MRLSRYSDLGLRALMYIAAHRRNVSAREVADAYHVSRDHVTKSMQGLVSLGVLSSTPGRNGGFELHADPETVQLGELVRRLEPSLAIAECFADGSACPLTGACELAGALFQAREAFFRTLNGYTLADLVEGTRPGLVQLALRSSGTAHVGSGAAHV